MKDKEMKEINRQITKGRIETRKKQNLILKGWKNRKSHC